MVYHTRTYPIIIYGSTFVATCDDDGIVDAYPMIAVLEALYEFATRHYLDVSKT